MVAAEIGGRAGREKGEEILLDFLPPRRTPTKRTPNGQTALAPLTHSASSEQARRTNERRVKMPPPQGHGGSARHAPSSPPPGAHTHAWRWLGAYAGEFAAFVGVLASHAIVLGLYAAVARWDYAGEPDGAMSVLRRLQPTPRAAVVYFGFVAVQALFAVALPGPVAFGFPLRTRDGGHVCLAYKCNGLGVWNILSRAFLCHSASSPWWHGFLSRQTNNSSITHAHLFRAGTQRSFWWPSRMFWASTALKRLRSSTLRHVWPCP